jgi:hypothetical protein
MDGRFVEEVGGAKHCLLLLEETFTEEMLEQEGKKEEQVALDTRAHHYPRRPQQRTQAVHHNPWDRRSYHPCSPQQ